MAKATDPAPIDQPAEIAAAPLAPKDSGALYDVYNPTPRRRVIFDGIENKAPIAIVSKETKKDVLLSAMTVRRLRERAALIGDANELEVLDPESAKPAPKAKVAA
jgi:hypothetical protein